MSHINFKANTLCGSCGGLFGEHSAAQDRKGNCYCLLTNADGTHRQYKDMRTFKPLRDEVDRKLFKVFVHFNSNTNSYL